MVGGGSASPRGRRAEAQLPGSGSGFGSVLPGSGQHRRLKLSGAGSYDPQVSINLGLGDMVFSERKEMEVWASEGPWYLGIRVLLA